MTVEHLHKLGALISSEPSALCDTRVPDGFDAELLQRFFFICAVGVGRGAIWKNKLKKKTPFPLRKI